MSLAIRNNLVKGLSWNFTSLIFIGLGGFSLNVFIGRIYGAAALGVFNQVLAYYLIASQCCVGGFFYSTLHFTSRNSNDYKEFSSITITAVGLVILLSSVMAIISWSFADVVADLLDSPEVAIGIRWVAFGLIPFAINRVLFSALNGNFKMRVYAICQSCRYLLFLFFLFILIKINVKPSTLPVLFLLSESILLVGLSCYFFVTYQKPSNVFRSPWWRKHLFFSSKAWIIGLLMDANTKVDICMLGHFSTDRIVGIYSFAILFIDGLGQLIVVVQNNLNPLLASFSVAERYEETKRLVKATFKRFTPAIVVVFFVTIFLFPWITKITTADIVFQEARLYFSIVGFGMVLSSAYLPFNMVLNQYGNPGLFTFFITSTVVVNIVLNYLLIPLYGASGAAVATSLAFICQVPLLKIFVYKEVRGWI